MQKFRLSLLLALILFATVSWSADSPWQTARMVDVKTVTNNRNPVWIVNTPINDEETECIVRVHIQTKIIQAGYVLGKSQPTLPAEWVKHTPVRVQVVGNTLFLKALEGDDFKLHIISTKVAPMMDPLTPEELAAEKAASAKEQPKSMIGFDSPESNPKQPSAPAPPAAVPPPPPEPTTGTVSISSVPYLAEVFVDGASIGYTPAKLKLAPGKHEFRCEKNGYRAWTKEITVSTGSEQTLDATLEPERK